MGLAEEMLKRADALSLELVQSKARIRELEEIEKVARNYMNYGITHHKDGCRPKDKCECGLWKLQEALSEKSDKEK